MGNRENARAIRFEAVTSKFSFRILTKMKGPIVRISPYELHIKDADYHDELYPGPSVRKTNKYHWTMKMFGPSQSTFQTADHDLHHIRRAALMPFFSTASVKKVEPFIQEVTDKLTARLYGLKGSGKPINLLDVFSSFTGDVTGKYAFNKDFGYLDTPDFAPWWHQTIMDFSENGHKFKQFEWLEPLQRNLPRWFVKIVNPQVLSIFAMNDVHAKASLVALLLLTLPREWISKSPRPRPTLPKTKNLLDTGQSSTSSSPTTRSQHRRENKVESGLKRSPSPWQGP